MFRNYDPKGKQNYLGDSTTQLWQALCANTAAATYFEPIEIDPGAFFTDGGILANNPSEVALNELKSVFGITEDKIACFVSLGTGQIAWKSSDPSLFNLVNKLSLIQKKLILIWL